MADQPNFLLDSHAKEVIRKALKTTAGALLGVKYKYRAEWTDYSVVPDFLDCSEFVEGVFRKNGLKMDDGAQNQFNFTVAVEIPQVGDLAFFAEDKDITRVDHSGIVYSDTEMIECRGFDEKASFPTGMVIVRPRVNWEKWHKFVGYRSHPKLA